jgi:hypothetical protein
VQRDDGRILVWPEGTNVANINGGRIAEEYRLDDGPRKTAPYKPEVSPKVSAVLAAALGDDGAKQAIEALLAAGFQIVETPRPCR